MTPPPSKKEAQRASKSKREREENKQKIRGAQRIGEGIGHNIRVDYKIHVITKLKRLIIEQLPSVINFI